MIIVVKMFEMNYYLERGKNVWRSLFTSLFSSFTLDGLAVHAAMRAKPGVRRRGCCPPPPPPAFSLTKPHNAFTHERGGRKAALRERERVAQSLAGEVRWGRKLLTLSRKKEGDRTKMCREQKYVTLRSPDVLSFLKKRPLLLLLLIYGRL